MFVCVCVCVCAEGNLVKKVLQVPPGSETKSSEVPRPGVKLRELRRSRKQLHMIDLTTACCCFSLAATMVTTMGK